MTAFGSNIGQIYRIPSPSRRKKLCNVYRTPFVVVICHTPLAVGKSTVVDRTFTLETRVATPLTNFTTSSRPFMVLPLIGLRNSILDENCTGAKSRVPKAWKYVVIMLRYCSLGSSPVLIADALLRAIMIQTQGLCKSSFELSRFVS